MSNVLTLACYSMLFLFQALSDESAPAYDPDTNPWDASVVFAAVAVIVVVIFVVYRIFKYFQKTRDREMEQENAYRNPKKK